MAAAPGPDVASQLATLSAQLASLQMENAQLRAAVGVPAPTHTHTHTPAHTHMHAGTASLPYPAMTAGVPPAPSSVVSAGLAPATPASLPGGRLAAAAAASMAFAGVSPAAAPGVSESVSGAPRRSFGEVKVWVGTWNMGAEDPFAKMASIPHNMDAVARLLAPFIPKGYDVYVLGVQEGISDKVFEAVEAFTETFRLPLNCKLYPAREAEEARVRSRRMGRAITVQTFIDEAARGIMPEPVMSTSDMLDRVWGRGDGALLTPKFTGLAVFVAPVVAPYCRLLGVYKHSFGASEGSKGGVGVALGIYDVTVAFVNAHMASKRADMRRAQYQELTDRLGAKLGGRGFGLNEEFHHIIWMGDLNVHCKDLTAEQALAFIRQGKHVALLLQYDELLRDKEEELAWYEFEEPLMAPRFYPTYKKRTHRGRINYKDPDWVNRVYVAAFKEPFYKGGRVMERVPSWTDRIQYHSLPDRAGELLPELLDPEHPDTSPHNYHAVNDVLDFSDHSPVFATFSLQICAEEVDEAVAEAIEAMQSQMGYGNPMPDVDESGAYGDGGSVVGGSIYGGAAGSVRTAATIRSGVMSDAVFSALHPLLRPLVVVLHVSHILVDYRGSMRSPRAVSVLFPLPYEDSNEIPERAKIVRQGTLFSFAPSAASETRDGIAATVKTLVSRASKLENLHMLMKVSLDDNTKAQCVICMKDGGFVREGSHMNVFLQPLTANGVPLKVGGKPVNVQFSLEMNAYARGGTQSGSTAVAAPVTTRTKPAGGALAMRRAMLAEGGVASHPGTAAPGMPATGAPAAPAGMPMTSPRPVVGAAATGTVAAVDSAAAARARAAEMMAAARARGAAAAPRAPMSPGAPPGFSSPPASSAYTAASGMRAPPAAAPSFMRAGGAPPAGEVIELGED